MNHCHCTYWALPLALLLTGCGKQEGQPRQAASSTEKHVTLKPGVEPAKAEHAPTTSASQKVMLGAPELLAGIPGEGAVTVSEIQRWLEDAANHAPLEFELPMWVVPGAGQMKDLKDHPMTRAKIELGRQLFFDKRLSADDSISCASCHEPDKGYTVSIALAFGINGQLGKRNPPTLLNRVMLSIGNDQQFWDGRTSSVEDALLHALSDPTEMAASPDATIDKLKKIEGYRLQFDRIYGDVSWQALGDSVGCFIRCLVTGSAPYDYFEQWEQRKNLTKELLADDPELAAQYQEAKQTAAAHPMSDSAIRGERLFFGNKAWCVGCHCGVNLTDESYHNIGIGSRSEKPDLGRYQITKRHEDRGAFKTPTIRAAAYTAPFMHDGSLATLEEVVERYATEAYTNPDVDARYRRIREGELSEQDKRDLVEFIKVCSGPLPVVASSRLPQ